MDFNFVGQIITLETCETLEDKWSEFEFCPTIIVLNNNSTILCPLNFANSFYPFSLVLRGDVWAIYDFTNLCMSFYSHRDDKFRPICTCELVFLFVFKWRYCTCSHFKSRKTVFVRDMYWKLLLDPACFNDTYLFVAHRSYCRGKDSVLGESRGRGH